MKQFVVLLLFNVISTVTSQTTYPYPGSNDHLYPYGPGVGDLTLPRSDDVSSPEIILSTNLVFFNGTYDSCWVSSNGIITMESSYTAYNPQSFPLNNNNPSIAAYLCDIHPSVQGSQPDSNVYYRQTTDDTLLQRATGDVLSTFGSQVPHFEATWLLVATWHNVTFYGYSRSAIGDDPPVVTFQIVLVSDGVHSFALYNYGDQMDWTTATNSGGNSNTGLGGTEAQIGFDAGDGVNFYNMEVSQTAAILNVTGQSFHYRIDAVHIADIEDMVTEEPLTIPITTIIPTLNCTFGFVLSDDGQRCIEVDECSSSPCGAECGCKDDVGAYQCLDKQEQPVTDEESCVIIVPQEEDSSCLWCWLIPVIIAALLIIASCIIFAICYRKKRSKKVKPADKETYMQQPPMQTVYMPNVI